MYLVELRAHLSRSASLAVAGALLALSGNVLAQDSDEEAEAIVAAAEEAAQETVAEAEASMDEITVTGSRIKRTEFNTTSPIQVITSERSQLAGLLDTSEILQNSTVSSGQQLDNSFSGFVVNGGNGANSISLRGLGEQRTLVLVNGKRWGPSGVRGATNYVDLTAMPSSQIQRYEILKDGASSIYGADAVAGVINAITKQRYDGSQINASVFAPENGNGRYSVDGIWGRTGDNWSFNVSGVYTKIKKTYANEMPYAPCPTSEFRDGSRVDADGNDLCWGMIYGFMVGPTGWVRYEPSLTDPGDDTNPYWDPYHQGALGLQYFTEVPVNSYVNQGPFWRAENDYEVTNLMPDNEIIGLNSFGDVDFSIANRSANAYYEFYYNRRKTHSASGYRQFFPTVPSTNPTSPWAPFGPQYLSQPVIPSFNLSNPDYVVDVERINAFVGLKGDISENWTYDTYFGYSKSEGTYEGQGWYDDRVNASVDAEYDLGGNLVCSAASLAMFPDCVTANLYTEDALLNGRLPQEYMDWITLNAEGNTEYTQSQIAGYVTGDLFSFADRAVAAVFGFEFRDEKINDVPHVESQADNIWGSTAALITRGSHDVTEFFTEIEIPILRDSPLGKDLTINGGYRYTDYSSYGGDDTYKLGVNWQITDLFRIRGTKGTSFRAPALYELYLGDQSGFLSTFSVDPCVNWGDPNTSANVAANCAAQGLAPDFPDGGAPSVKIVTGGGRDLKAETSDSWTAGIVLTPDVLNTSFAVTMFDIQIENTVANPSAGYLAFRCYDSENFSSPFCNRVGPRDEFGFITEVNDSPINIGRLRSRGVDYDILFQKDFASFDLSIDVTATQLLEQDRELFGTVTDFHGKFGYPEWAANADIRVDYKDFTAFWGLNYVGSSAETGANPLRYCDAPSQIYNNVSLRYVSENKFEITGTIRNLLNKQPPTISGGCGSETASVIFNTIPGAGYDLFGRAFTLRVAKGFDF